MTFHYREFQPETDVFKSFDCGKSDLNDFLLETDSNTPNATLYEREHLGKTYIVEEDGTGVILAYLCLYSTKLNAPLPIQPFGTDFPEEFPMQNAAHHILL